jgi:hypothetical protein
VSKTHTFFQKMTKLTDRVAKEKALTDEMYTNYSGHIGAPLNKDSDLQKTFKDNLYGSVVVRDLLNYNTHFLATSSDASVPGKDAHLHVEEWLTTKVCKHFESMKCGLTCAKVAFYMEYSPCVKCTAAIPEWCANMSKAITGSAKSRKIFFVFNYRCIYAFPDFKLQGHVHPSRTKANKKYAAIAQIDDVSSWTETLTTHKGGQFVVPRINFREIVDVKNASLFGKKVIGSDTPASGASGAEGKQEVNNNA